MRTFFELIIRELNLFRKNTVILAIFIAAPIAYALLTGSIYKDAKIYDLPIVVADLDETPFGDKIIDALDDNQYLKVAAVKHEKCDFKHEILKNNYLAVITIPKGFQADIEQKRHPEINAEINGGNMLTANYASTGIMNVLATANAGFEIGALQKEGMPSAIAVEQFESFQINIARFYNPASNYLMFLWPGILGTIMQQVFLLAMALSFAQEFETGKFAELLSHTKSALFMLAVKSIPYLIIGLLLWFPLMRIFMPIFHVPIIEAGGAYWLVSGLFVLSLTFMGTAVSIAFPSQLKATEILMIIATPSFIISGQTWPLIQMPVWVQNIAACIPLTHYLEAFRRLLLFKAGIADILPQITALSIIAGITFIIAFILLKIKIKKSLKPIIVS
jgi:ABC-2 type transport system permease protein